ncbi:transcriptional regulator, putative [Trichophyton verrucosum HKI 0517]|uniref:Transcriptional regulator, putative n=1 Tax=Trichophyton verrucosum (strain HKI 0517) TaxID=663202 RepID=D4D7Q0_TRIVH|nr:transcriptional regulator, putative [Trichophyton verrucosum HKI 0517]EFE42134.1 transcriptional regulator, putative [Trichophyton verrucosum HKI 0517]
MSDPGFETRSSSGLPSAEAIEQGLRATVAKIYKSGNLDELTVKRVRLATEKNLGLEQGVLKAHAEWKQKSDEIIKDEVENPPPKSTAAPTKPRSKKRPSPETQKASKPVKKRKKATSVQSEKDSNSMSSEERDPMPISNKKSKAPPMKVSRNKNVTKVDAESEEDNSDQSDGDKSVTCQPKATSKATKAADAEGDSESEMSVLIDEEPKPKKGKSTARSTELGKGKKTKSGKTRKETVPEDPDQAEIKRLQDWLVKCGIRKVWGRELMGCSTPKEKIRHLKSMLKDAGMDGRYSIEKANRIREDRELRADLEAAQEGAKKWGANIDEEEESSKTGRSSRRIAKSFKQFDFLGQDDQDSESD